MTISQTNLAYAAGIIDGEGTIVIIKAGGKKAGGKYHNLAVIVHTADLIIASWFYNTFGGSLNIKKGWGPKRSDGLVWRITSKKASLFLAQILPYIKLKRQQAELAIAFQNLIGRHGFPVSEASQIQREEKRQQMKNLNRRGTLSLTA